ncbi:hypothetical protein IAR55_006672 [Kwoniella newhampshirensis]|uniref:Dolichol-phosphate mannosyltransferase n=1 Tax=Kwoniella newhampshirensis TaxID=1651941 RepID=A0AAW0YXE4_9TREE
MSPILPPLSGVLTTFACGQYTYPIFTSGDLTATRAVVFVGGLTNGMGGVPYSYPLSDALGKAGWKLVQFHWSSAYGGYGTGSLDRDRDEMAQLVKHLRSNDLKTIVIMGHSTGSQNVIHYLSSSVLSSDPETRVEGGIMQAPVSDREFMPLVGMKDHIAAVPLAEKMIAEGNGEELMPKDFRKKAGFGQGELAINAYRLWSLVGVGGDDDYFSSDIPLDPTPPFRHSLSDSFGVLSAPALALYSEKDAEYQVAKPEDLLPRWADAAKGKLEWRILKGASHDVSEPEAQVVVCDEVLGWLRRFE